MRTQGVTQGTQTREHTARAHAKLHAHIKTGHDGSVNNISQDFFKYVLKNILIFSRILLLFLEVILNFEVAKNLHHT